MYICVYIYIKLQTKEKSVFNPLQQNCLLKPNCIPCRSSYAANVLLMEWEIAFDFQFLSVRWHYKHSVKLVITVTFSFWDTVANWVCMYNCDYSAKGLTIKLQLHLHNCIHIFLFAQFQMNCCNQGVIWN